MKCGKTDARKDTITLLCGSKKEPLNTQRKILGESSRQFQRIFEQFSCDAPSLTAIELDVKKEDFYVILEYCYKRTLTHLQTTEEKIKALCLALKYEFSCMVEDLVIQLKLRLTSRISSESLDTATRLLEHSWSMINEKTVEIIFLAQQIAIFQLDNLLDKDLLLYTALDFILRARDLKYRPPEEHLFEMADKWETAFCKKRDMVVCGKNKRIVLKNILDLINFREISDTFLAKNVSDSGILTEDELCRLITSKYVDTVKPPIASPGRSGTVLHKRLDHAELLKAIETVDPEVEQELEQEIVINNWILYYENLQQDDYLLSLRNHKCDESIYFDYPYQWFGAPRFKQIFTETRMSTEL